MILSSYRSVDLYPHKYGVQPIIHGYLNKFKPWYFDGSAVWWGKEYELRSAAEDAARQLKEGVAYRYSNRIITDGSEKNSVRP